MIVYIILLAAFNLKQKSIRYYNKFQLRYLTFNLQEMNEPQHLKFFPPQLPFNQQSTNKFLKQLKDQLKDVQQIIKKSKESLGVYSNNKVNNSLTFSKQEQEINLQMSLTMAQNTIKDELNYSMSPKVESRIIKSGSLGLFSKDQCEIKMKKLASQESQQNLLLQSRSLQASINDQDVYDCKHKPTQEIDSINQNQQNNQSSDIKGASLNAKQAASQQIIIQQIGDQDSLDKVICQDHENGSENSKKPKYFLKNKQLPLNLYKQLYTVEKWNKKAIKNNFAQNIHPFSKKMMGKNSKKLQQIGYKSQNQNMPAISSFLIQKSSLGNTCTNNQLQNILLKQYKKQNNKGGFKNKSQNINIKQLNQSYKTCTSKTYKSIYQQNKVKRLNIPMLNKARSLQKKDNSQLDTKNSKQKNKSIKMNKQKHKSIQKYIEEALNQSGNNNTQKNVIRNKQKQQFLSQMENHCYVRRFLNSNQLSAIYNQFSNKKIKKSEWGQKIIVAIFKKINQTSHLL